MIEETTYLATREKRDILIIFNWKYHKKKRTI